MTTPGSAGAVGTANGTGTGSGNGHALPLAQLPAAPSGPQRSPRGTVPATDVLSNRRIPASSSGSKPTTGSADSNAGVDVAGIARLLNGVVLDKDDAVVALNKLLQRALRAVPFVTVQHLRETIERFEQATLTLEANCSEAELEARLTPGSRVSRLKYDNLKNLALRQDVPSDNGVQRVVVPDTRLVGSGVLIGEASGDAPARPTPPSQHRIAATSASLSSLQTAAMQMVRKRADSPENDAAPTGVLFVPTPLATKLTTSAVTKDFDSPSMARRTLAGVKRPVATGLARRQQQQQQQHSDSDDDENNAPEHAPASSTTSAMGLGLRGAGGNGGEMNKPRNKLLDKVSGGAHVRSSSRASVSTSSNTNSPQLPAPVAVVASPATGSISSTAGNTSSMDSPNLGGRRLGGRPAANAVRAQSSLLNAAVVKPKPLEDEKVDSAAPSREGTPAVSERIVDTPTAASGFMAPPPTPALPTGELLAPETQRKELQQLLHRALRLVPVYQFTPASFRQLHMQLETAVAFMEEHCGPASK